MCLLNLLLLADLILVALFFFFFFVLNLTPGRQALYLYLWGKMSNQSWQLPLLPYYRWRNWGTSQLSNLPRISHIARLWRTWIQTQEIHSRFCYSLITLLCRLRLGAWQRGIKCLWIEATWKTKPSHPTSTGKPPKDYPTPAESHTVVPDGSN